MTASSSRYRPGACRRAGCCWRSAVQPVGGPRLFPGLPYGPPATRVSPAEARRAVAFEVTPGVSGPWLGNDAAAAGGGTWAARGAAASRKARKAAVFISPRSSLHRSFLVLAVHIPFLLFLLNTDRSLSARSQDVTRRTTASAKNDSRCLP